MNLNVKQSVANGSPPRLGAKVIQLLLLHAGLFASIILNGVVAYVLLSNKNYAKTTANLFIAILTGLNCVSSVAFIPLTIASAPGDFWILGTAMCDLTAFLQLVVFLYSNFILALLAADRYYAIVKPIVYRSRVTKRKTVALLLCTAATSLIIALAPICGWSQYAYHPHIFACVIRFVGHPVFGSIVIGFGFILPGSIMFLAYFHIYQAAKVQETRLTVSVQRDPYTSKAHIKFQRKLPWLMVTYSAPRKALRRILFMLGTYTGIWLVYLAWVICDTTERCTGSLAFGAFFAVVIQSILYPILYAFGNKSIRASLKDKLLQQTADDSPTERSTSFSFMDYLPTTEIDECAIDPSDILQYKQTDDIDKPSSKSGIDLG